MNPIYYFLLFPIVGAVIGALTNELAIKMLFRPYKPLYFGKIKLPFTPGVIPSQRGIIAGNIAETFEKHLLSGKEIHSVITNEKTAKTLEKKVDEMFASLGPIAVMAAPFKPKIVEKILEGIDEVASNAVDNGDLNIRQKIEDKINEMDIKTLEDLVLGFSRKQFRHITLFGGILGFLIGLVQASLTYILS